MIVTEEIMNVADFMISLLGTDCSGDAELTYLTLRVFLFFPYCSMYIILLLLVEKKSSSSFYVFIPDRLLETWVQ